MGPLVSHFFPVGSFFFGSFVFVQFTRCPSGWSCLSILCMPCHVWRPQANEKYDRSSAFCAGIIRPVNRVRYWFFCWKAEIITSQQIGQFVKTSFFRWIFAFFEQYCYNLKINLHGTTSPTCVPFLLNWSVIRSKSRLCSTIQLAKRILHCCGLLFIRPGKICTKIFRWVK